MANTKLELRSEIHRAVLALRGLVRETPVVRVVRQEPAGSVTCCFKLENRQITGSFKYRGAMNRLLALDRDERRKGVFAASTGNHGAAVARAARELGIQARILVPSGADESKLEAIRQFGGEILVFGDDCVEAECEARRRAAAFSSTFVSPYNDPLVIAGQGTIGLELLDQTDGLDAIFVALGGGGLAAGIAAAVKTDSRQPDVIGCSPENSPVLYRAIESGSIVDVPVYPTLSDATAGGLEPDAITVALCSELLDGHELVSEQEIAREMVAFNEDQGEWIEGAAAVALAGLRRRLDAYAGKTVAVVICGGNVSEDTKRKVIRESRAAGHIKRKSE